MKSLLMCILLLGVVSSAQATKINDLLVRDYFSTGDGLITYDRSTNLEWLDLPYTEGLSINDIESSAFFVDDGWGWASSLEYEALMTTWSDPALTTRTVTNDVEGIVNATYLLKLIGSSSTSEIVGFSRNFERVLCGISNNTTEYCHETRSFNISAGEYAESKSVDITNYFGFRESDSRSFVGAFLVRPSVVPVPAAAWLFGSALLGFFGFSRRKANA